MVILMNLVVWFNIGQKGCHYVQWQSAMINGDFDADSIRVESCYFDENDNPVTEWVTLEEYGDMMPRSVAPSFSDLQKVADAVRLEYETGEEQYMGHKNWTHIYAIFDMDDCNEYGVGKTVWEHH